MFPSVLCLVFLAIPTAVPSVAAEGESPDAGVWMGRMLDALGGRDALDDLSSLAVAADCSGPGGEFETRVSSFRPSWASFDQRDAVSATRIWTGPTRTWSLGEDGGAEDHGPDVRSFVRSHEFHLVVLEVDERFTGHRLDSPATAGGEPCAVIRMMDDAGKPATLFISEATHMPVVLELNPDGAAGPIRITFDGWETHAGLRFFRGFDLAEGSDRSFRYDYRSIEPNTVSALEFVEPAPPGLDAERGELLDILEEDRRAHLETDAALLAGNVAESLTDVSNGAIRSMTRDQVETLFNEVFKDAVYDRWEDTEPPRLVISPDGSLAWIARRVRVRRSTPDEGGTGFVSAYSATYEKGDGGWKMTSVTSTFLPESSD